MVCYYSLTRAVLKIEFQYPENLSMRVAFNEKKLNEKNASVVVYISEVAINEPQR